jgi:hypothetical protein
MQVNGQLACRSVPGSADRGRTVRPHPGPVTLFLDVPKLPGELPAELPAKSVLIWPAALAGPVVRRGGSRAGTVRDGLTE